MSNLDELLRDLVIANRILAHEGVVDAFGHISFRHPDRPDRFFLSCSRSPELISRDDLIEYDLNCTSVDPAERREQYREKAIHGSFYRARPDVHSVVHNHAEEVIPFSVNRNVKLKPIFLVAARIGREVPVWDIHDRFGDTDLMVHNLEQGGDLAATLGQGSAVLMRGHGCAVAAKSLYSAVHISIYLMVNARLQSEAMRFGGNPTYLTDGEIELMSRYEHGPKSRQWEYWAKRVGLD